VTATAARRRTKGSRTITYAWAVLCTITIGSWWLAPGHTTHTATPSIAITTAVVLLGFVKGRLVIRYFMAVNTAPRWLKVCTDAWLFTLWLAVLAIYLY
jgi:hypothetical protein